MALREETREIDGHTFFARQMLPLQALRLQARLAKLIGPAAPFLAEATKGDISGAVNAVFGALNPDEAITLMTDLLKTLTKDGRQVGNIDVDFVDCELPTMYKAAGFVLELNFKDFFGVLKKAQEGLAKR